MSNMYYMYTYAQISFIRKHGNYMQVVCGPDKADGAAARERTSAGKKKGQEDDFRM